ncbi:MAG: hypothetical protein HEQ17_11305 [Limnohabitans sp.]|uniref:hypothetical protein n=1 Tax=Limnohabitans sp. TaxID=1907725 RepID=UPI0025EA7DA3|nr:hypothetical protein [Limnohabitans sp.]MCO4089492.1 hypothetical protein [Limnohabitans sp.]
MNELERWAYINELDESLLLRCVVLSEWCSFIVRQADIAFTKGADLAAIFTSVSAAETYLRAEFAEMRRERLADLIDKALIKPAIKVDLHKLRQYRNKWVHVESPWDEQTLLADDGAATEKELEDMAAFAVTVLRRLIYENQWT